MPDDDSSTAPQEGVPGEARITGAIQAEDPTVKMAPPGVASTLAETVKMPLREARPALPFAESPGEFIGPYQLIEPIGEGGFGTVWRAEQKEPILREVALKVIKLGMDSREIIARFEAERQALALMDHPNIAAVLDAGTTENGRPFFAMELVKGVPITEYCDAKKLSIRQRLELFIPVCQAVQHAHQKAILHRDLKPSNILVTEVDGKPVPKVIDFGIAKALHPTTGRPALHATLAQTVEGMIVGTPQYMSPEQAGSVPDVDTRSDIYTLGVIIYELLTGEPPLGRDQIKQAAVDEVLRLVREDEARRPSSKFPPTSELAKATASLRHTEPRKLGHALRGDLDWIVLKALEKDRARRYDTATAFSLDLRRYLDDEPVSAGPPGVGYRLRKLVRRNKGPVAAAATIVLLIVAGLVSSTLLYLRERAARSRAETAERTASIEGRRSEQIAKFMKEIFLGITPNQAKGQDTQLLKQMLERASQRINGELSNQPELEAELRTTMGHIYRIIGLYHEGLPHLQRAVELERMLHGGDHQATLFAMDNFAGLLEFQDKFEEASVLLRHILEVQQRVHGADHPLAVAAMRRLASVCQKQGKWAEAESLRNKALDTSSRMRGSEHPETLEDLLQLARLQAVCGKLTEADALYARILDAQRRTLGDEHPRTLFTMTSVAQLYQRSGKHAEAEPLVAKILEVKRRVRGAEHPETLLSMFNLAQIYWTQGKFKQAEPLARQALELQRKMLGDTHPDTLASMSQMSAIYQAQGRLSEAEPYLKEALEVRRRILPKGSRPVLASLAQLAQLQADQKKWHEAEHLCTEEMTLLRKPESKRDEAYARAAARLGSVRTNMQRFAEAEEPLREALAVRRDLMPESWLRYASERHLGSVLVQLKKLDEAGTLLHSAFGGLKTRVASIPPAELHELVDAAEALAALAKAQGDDAAVINWAAEAGRLREETRLKSQTKR